MRPLPRARACAHPQVDCTKEMALCQSHYVTGFPSIRVFRRGHDDIYIAGMHEHESYT